MCRVLAYIGPELPLDSLLLHPENSLINQSLDPELHPLLQLAGWGFGCWSDHLLKPEDPLTYHRPISAFFDDNARGLLPSLQASTLLAHVRAADYDDRNVLTDENCHPFRAKGTRWIMAQNGALPDWRVLQRDLLPLCKDHFLRQMQGTTDTEFLYVLLMSLLEGDSDDHIRAAVERMVTAIQKAMQDRGLEALTKLKIALVSQNRVIGINTGLGHAAETQPKGDWKELRKAGPNTDDYHLSMLLEPMYLLMGRDFENHANSYRVDPAPEGEATSAIFASEPLTEEGVEWQQIGFGEMVSLRREDGVIVKNHCRFGL